MEEKSGKNRKLTYEELSKAAGDIHAQYQKLMAEYQKAMEALRSRDFDYTSFFLSMLFKVLDHPELYKDEFVKWCVDSIEAALTTFSDSLRNGVDSDKEEKGETE